MRQASVRTGCAGPIRPALPNGSAVSVTTGHAATVVSVVRTAARAAPAATGRELAGLEMTVVGLGSIGVSSLELLLTLAERPPARLVLCDVPGCERRRRELARSCGNGGWPGRRRSRLRPGPA